MPKPVQGLPEKPEASLDPESDDPQFVSVQRPETQLLDPDAFLVEARVVYLGGNPFKAVYYNGVERETENARGEKVWRPVFTRDTGTQHVFERVDTLGRPIPSRLIRRGQIRGRDDLIGKPFVVCRHIGHLALFLKELDAENAPAFEIVAPPSVTAKIETYLKILDERRRSNPDRGHAVLQAMHLA